MQELTEKLWSFAVSNLVNLFGLGLEGGKRWKLTNKMLHKNIRLIQIKKINYLNSLEKLGYITCLITPLENCGKEGIFLQQHFGINWAILPKAWFKVLSY